MQKTEKGRRTSVPNGNGNDMVRRDALAALEPVLDFEIGKQKLISIFSGVLEKMKKLQESTKISSWSEHLTILYTTSDKTVG